MALFWRLFGGKKNDKEEKKCSECKWPQLEGSVKWTIPDFHKSQIRLVIFKDNILCGRTVLFDSKAIKLVEETPTKKSCLGSKLKLSNSHPNLSSRQPKYQLERPGSDTKMLGEMMFGSVAMSYHGSSVKVHSIRCPPQLMFSKILTPSTPSFSRSRTSSCDDFDSQSLHSSLGDVTSDSLIFCKERATSQPDIARSVPVEIPSPVPENEPSDSGLSMSLASSGSFTPIFPPSPCTGQASINSCSYKSFQRRWHRSQQTCLEYGVRSRYSDPDMNSGSHSLPTPTCKKSFKLGVGIVINLFGEANKAENQEIIDLFFSHITLLERHVEKLAESVERVVNCKKQFVHTVMESLAVFADSLVDLFLTPRLTQPVWLNMMSPQTNRQMVCLQFISEFTNLVNEYDLKENNFFISTLLTAVLTHHLAWVPTVTPSGLLPSRAYMDKHSAKWLDTLARSHPYNPLWAQLSDLYGAIGYPMKMSRTVIVGKNQTLICTLLYVLSYFIRCSEVYERTHVREPDFSEHEDLLLKEMSPIKETGVNEEIMDSGIDLNSRGRMESNEVDNVECNSISSISPNPSVISSTPRELEPVESSRCKLSETDLVPVKMETVLPVQKADTSTTQILGNSKFYVRLSSDEEAIVAEMDGYFDGKTEVCTSPTTCYCGKSTCYLRCTTRQNKLRSDDAGFVSMESCLSSDDIIPDASDAQLSPRTTSENDVFQYDVTDDVIQKGRHTSGERSILSKTVCQPSVPARCKSTTPTELGLRRYKSSSSIDSEVADPFLRLREIALPRDCDQQQPMKEFARNFGHSLMAGLSDHYLSDFVLHGTCDPQFYRKVEDDLSFSARVSVLDETINEVSCIVADVGEHQVYALTCSPNEKLATSTIQASQLVVDLVGNVSRFWSLNMPPEFCLMHLEDRLQEIYFKSRMLAEYLRQQKKSNIKDLTDVLGFDCSDLPLLLAVASTHSPELAFRIS